MNHSETIRARISAKLKEPLQQIAQARGVSLSEVIRDALFEFVERAQDGEAKTKT